MEVKGIEVRMLHLASQSGTVQVLLNSNLIAT